MMSDIYRSCEENAIEEAYAKYLAEQAREDWERQVEADAYNMEIIPQYMDALEEEEEAASVVCA